MDISAKSGSPTAIKSACIIVAVYANKRLSEAAKNIDNASQGMITRLTKRGDISGKQGEWLMLPEVAGIQAERVLLVGCGKLADIDAAAFIKIAAKAAETMAGTHLRNAISCLGEIKVKQRDRAWTTQQQVLAFIHAAYRFDQLKSKPEKTTGGLTRLSVMAEKGDIPMVRAAIASAEAIGKGMNLTKDLGNLPGNYCTPNHLAKTAKALAKEFKKIKTTVLEEADMRKLRMGALLSVSAGSRQAAKLITLQYSGAAKTVAPIVLVGKGVTFDSGGISIKASPAMDEMKYDMCGAGSVLGTLSAVAEMDLPINVVGIIPATENLPDGLATKPGDIVTSMSGQTIEVLNTDAEGRLILCDALTYSARFKPAVVIDIATLTGACVMALGHHTSGLLSNDDKLANQLLAAGETSGDRAWRLPLFDEYQKQIDSPFADMANVGGRPAGTITAACFLSRFTKDYRWAHLDIAGTAWRSGGSKGATARPVPLLTQFIVDQCKTAK